ncbi:MAG: AraC family transcriptional regulator [Clostridia bacterium]
MAEHYREELSLAAVANHIGIHPNYFSNLFTKQCGVSYSHYLRGVRIEAACLRMRESDCKLYEIAEEVGYHDQVQFNRAFREEKGCAPSAYQKKR